ncbi:family 2 glycosyl transferase [Clostridium bornimense]|uniref:Family 2 glycosyl transferase n=1 Tax=Clostridium bornimense TaxID=1216932 RepID=W6S0Y9_9CLOT|nr:glycosyltransferase family 2 protein [Clostridium bornimense]CDM69529.1 family 2 glycosyl transferase [Clostridium bornimense]
MDLSIVIVNYNTKDLLKQTIESVINNTKGIEYEIWVVDNSSKDGSVEMVQEEFKSVKLIASKENLGFPKGNNVAIKKAAGRYILLLNSDTKVIGDNLQNCVNYMDQHKEIGALGCKVELPDGTLDHACKRGFPTPEASLYYFLKLNKIMKNKKKYGAYTAEYLGEDEVGEVDALMGAFMMIPRTVIDKIGMLDEEFFMYGEDIDWCYRIKEAGYKIMYYPKEKIIHYKGSSSKKKKAKTTYEFHRAMILFYRKHYNDKYNIFIKILVYIGIALRMILSMIKNLFKKS